MRPSFVSVVLSWAILGFAGSAATESPEGYYRQPALHGETLVFVAEGDLWKVGVNGGVAERLTTHASAEALPSISPDGAELAFLASYEGPRELYTMPLGGGFPTRRTFGRVPSWAAWTPVGKLFYATTSFSDLPDTQLVSIERSADGGRVESPIPLAQAADGVFDADGGTLWFTRLAFQGSHTKRYKGGTAQQIWRFAAGDDEAVPLTSDYPGTSKNPMLWDGRVYFASDRDGTMNLWSMRGDGSDLQQHTRHEGWDLESPSLDGGRVVYQLGADLRLYDINAGTDRKLDIRLRSDFDQMRENWVDKPMDYVSSMALSPDGDRVALTARGRVFVVPARQGRRLEAAHDQGTRFREARFLADGARLVVLSDASGEVEVWTLPANGVGEPVQRTTDARVLRWEVVPSPDGKWAAHRDKDQQLWMLDLEGGSNVKIDESAISDLSDLAWSPDSRFLAYVKAEDNTFSSIRIHDREKGKSFRATTERYDSYSPAWSSDGKWLYFLSDRNLVSTVGSPWGNYQPEPFLDKKTRVLMLALTAGLRSPFAPDDELHGEAKKDKDKEKEADAEESGKTKKDKKTDKAEKKEEKKVNVEIDFEGLPQRLHAVPIPAGNYTVLSATEKALYFYERAAGERFGDLLGLAIGNEKIEAEKVATGVRFYDLSADGKKLLLRIGDALHVIEAKPKSADLKESKIDLDGWKLSIDPRKEWRQMFVESWRLERDYFYDRGMHGVDWPAMLEKYLPLVDRVTDRDELSDLVGQMVSELAALHTFVYGGDARHGDDDIGVAALGGRFVRDVAAGGYRVDRVYRSDSDDLTRISPLARPGVDVAAGAVIEKVNGRPTLEVEDLGVLLRDQAGRQVLIHVRDSGATESRAVIVVPINAREDEDLRYHGWEYTRRQIVDDRSDGEIGYVHLRAMGAGNFTEWAKGFYPAYNRKGLIVDVRHNRGGNIDSWILGRLMRRPWSYWSQRAGQAPLWNQQYAFRGHLVVLCNERTASDGEAFSEGFRRLGLGPLIGTRTWGGEIWLTSSNRLVDGGIATAAEFGVYGPEGDWLIEGWGVEPDIVVDNLPHATFMGQDAQLQAAIDYLKKKIAEEPVEPVSPPTYPDKSGRK